MKYPIDWFLESFEDVAYNHIHSQNKDKLDPRALKYFFIGYFPTQKGYKCHQPSSNKVFVSVDVTFDESESFLIILNQGQSLNGEEPLDFSLFDLSILVVPNPYLSYHFFSHISLQIQTSLLSLLMLI